MLCDVSGGLNLRGSEVTMVSSVLAGVCST